MSSAPQTQADEPLVYKQSMNRQELFKVLKAIGFPLLAFALELITISVFGYGYGHKLICPLSSIMWLVGFLTALILPSMRREVCNQTMITCSAYCGALLGIHILMSIVGGVSSEQLEETFSQVMPIATGNAIPGYLSTMLLFVVVGVPIGFVTMQAKRLIQFRRTQNLHKTFGQVRNMREGNKPQNRSF